MKFIPDLNSAIAYSRRYLANTGTLVKANAWQGQVSPDDMFEAMDLAFKCPMPESQFELIELVGPNMSWAEDHFLERVSGIPHNPPPSHQDWPFGKKKNEAFTTEEKFDHTYPERFWPKYANQLGFWDSFDGKGTPANKGIRFEYGDLKDVVTQLLEDLPTRQAYLPVFFPEDTGAKGGKKRVPCTLGYHFIIRGGYLHITYLMRSCDALRHFKDDIYMAVRLAQWVRDHLKPLEVKMGMIKFYATSYHIFNREAELFIKKYS